MLTAICRIEQTIALLCSVTLVSQMGVVSCKPNNRKNEQANAPLPIPVNASPTSMNRNFALQDALGVTSDAPVTVKFDSGRIDLNGVRALLDSGVDPNTVLRSGMTPLMVATMQNNADAIRLLIVHGAKVNAVDTLGMTALMVATQMSGTHRIHHCLMHLDIIDGKIWMQRDGTEDGIAYELEDAGVPKSDIVLAFHSEDVRPHTGYAVA